MVWKLQCIKFMVTILYNFELTKVYYMKTLKTKKQKSYYKSSYKLDTLFIRLGLFVFLFFASASFSYGQTRTASVSGNWNNTATWGGQSVPTAVNDVIINNNINVTIDVANAQCQTLTINGGANASFVTVGTNNLTVGDAITINAPTAAVDKYLTVSTGSISCASITMTASTNDAWDSYISITGTGSVTVSGNITMDGSNLRNFILFSGTGSLNIGGTFGGTTGGGITSNVNGAATAPTSGTVNFNGAGVQSIPAFSGYFNLSTSNSGTKTLANANITVGGALDVTNTTLEFANAAARTLTVTGNLSGNGTIDMSTGSQTHLLNLGGATNTIGTLTTAAVASTINYNRNGAQTIFASPNYRNLTTSTANTKTIQGDITVNDNLTITASTFDFGATIRTVNVLGNLSGTGTLSMQNVAHILNLGGANNAITTFTTTLGIASTVNYNRNGNQQIFTSTNYRNLTISIGGIKTFQGVTNVNNDLLISNSTLNLGTGAWIHNITGNTQIDGTLAFNGVGIKTLNITGNLSGAGTIDMSTLTHSLNLGGATNTIGTLTTTAVASTITYNRAGNQTVFGSPNYRNLTVSGGSNKTIQGDVTAGGTLTLTLGKIVLGTYNLTLTGAAAVGTPTATSYIVADGTGQLKKVMPNAGLPYTFIFPVGDVVNYSPVSLTFTANSIQRTIGVKVTDAVHPSNGLSTDYLSRYWSFTDDQAGTYTYNASFTFISPADLTGAYANLRVNRWDGANWSQFTTTGASPVLTITGANETTMTLNNNDYTGRVHIATYTWNQNGATANWATPANWTPSRFSPQPTDILLFDNSGTTTATNVPTQTIGQLILSNNSNVSLQSAAAAQTLTISGGANPTDLDIPVGSILQISSTGGNQLGIAFAPATQDVLILGTLSINANGALTNSFNATNSQTIVNGTINSSGTITSTAANLIFNSGSIYNHTRDAGVLPTANWNSASTINVTSTTVTAPTGLNQTFGNLNFNCAALTGARTATLTGAVIIGGNLSITGTSAVNTMTLQLAGQNFTVNGTTNINAFGILNDNAAAGTNLFAGLVTVNASGLWTTTNNPPFTFQGGLTNYGTMSATGTGAYTFNTNAQYIEGTQSITISNLVTTGITLTNRNTSSLTAGTITGTGNFVNGDVGFNAILTLTGGAPNPFGIGGTLTLASNPNTVNYNGAGAQTIGAYNFYNLTSSSTGARTLVNAGTIGVSSIFTPGTNVYTTTGSTIDFNGTSSQNIPSLPGAAVYNNLTVSGGSTKTLSGNITIGTAAAGVLNLNTAILELAGFNLTLVNTAINPFTGVFNSTNMISTGGTGYVQRNGSAAAHYQITYPVGSGGYYSPMTISSIAAAFPTYINVRTVPTAINPSYIKKYWIVQSSLASLTNVTATFQYDPAELNGASPSISYSPNSGTTWQNPPTVGASSYGANSFTITGNNPFNGWWTMGYKSYYSYQTGDWSDPTTWTSDPSGTLQIGTTIPGVNDNVIILTGRTVSLSGNIATANINLTINEGGFLDLSTFQFTQPLQTLTGQGTLKLASINFPTGTTSAFTNAGGGTTEYYNSANFTLPIAQTSYNNLTINTAGFVATQFNNITLNGNLYIKQGTFRLNDDVSATKLTLTINGNVTVDNGAFITVGRGTTNTTTNPIGITGGAAAPFINYYTHFHTMIVKGDFTNNGTVRFTNLTYPIYDAFPPLGSVATSGAVSVYFQGTTDNTLTCNGQTDFYNLILDKGTDQTYKLTVNSSDYSFFRLFGANTSGADITNPVATNANPNLKKALWIRTGTLVLQGFTVIPSLSEGTCNGAPNSDFYIPANGGLVIDGLNVIVLATADDYREVNLAYTVAGGTGLVNGVNQGACSSLSILGKLQINDGYFSTRESGGLITWDYASGQLEINGGTADVKQFRAAGGASGLGSYLQTGGTFIVRGRFQSTTTSFTAVSDLVNAPINYNRATDGSLDGAVGSFNLNATTNVFAMSGGTIKIYDACGVGGRVFDVLSSSGNINVSGGLIEFIPAAGLSGTADAATHIIRTTAPLGNVTINRASSASVVQLEPLYPLTILKDLTLQSGVFNANNLNVTIGGNFTVSSGTTYTTGTNSTILNGTGAQIFTVDLAAALNLNMFKIDKPAGTTVTFAGTQKTINVIDNFWLILGNLADNGNTINIAKDVYNSGVHSGTGKIVLNGVAQVQTIDGNGIFQNLELNNTNAAAAPISLIANTTINGVLTFSQDKLFNIGIYNLKLNSSASITNAGANRYIQTAGTLGDGGITRVYSNSTAFVFPLGAASTSHAATAYTPASIGFTGAPTYGSITINPVGYEHPTTTVNGRSLTYFWRVKSSGFTLGAATVNHIYTYAQTDVVGPGPGDPYEDGYVPARYNTSTLGWTTGLIADVDESTNTIGGAFLTGAGFIDGDYTAGDNAPTNPFGTPIIYYSRINGALAGNGLWSNVNTWSTVSHTGPAAAAVPGINDIVIIGAKDSVYLATNNTVPNTDPRSCASLQIEKGSALDIGYNPASSFGMALSHSNGNGNFRFTTSWTSGSTYAFPSGDFTDFNVNLGTTEIYSTNPAAGTTYWLPNNISSYGNLILSPLGGSNIIFGNTNLTIYGNLVTRGQDADSWFCPTWNVAYPTAPTVVIAKTITINGNLDIQSGGFIWYGNGAIAQNLVVKGDVKVAQLAALYVWGGATNQQMTIGGSLINNTNGVINAPATQTTAKCDFSLIPLTFNGSTSASITNTGATASTTFSTVTVNKGNSQTTTLTLDIGGTLTNTLADNWLTLQNGTFRYMRTNPTADFSISTVTPFTIPSTAGLYIDYSNTNNRNVLIGNSGVSTNDLFLDGKLTIVRGNVYVGPVAAPNFNNDIEYSGGGASAIDVQGGQLVVNGQIRRNAASTSGTLKYTQSGGTVTINGNAAINTRAKLEVLNAGSIFNMSGTSTLTIVRGGGGASSGDLYLRPASSSITGGNIIFTQTPAVGPAVAAVQSYLLESTVPLYDLTINGDAIAPVFNATLGLMVSPLTINGTLTLSNANSILNSNNNNITINNGFSNSGIYNYGTNTTTFSGGTQTIAGTSVTNFYDLVVSPVTSLTPNNSFTVNRNLNITNGILILGNNKLTLLGSLTNNGTYTDNNTVGGVSLNGTAQQQISGTGAFGRLELNNSRGAKINNSISLKGNFDMTLGIMDINQYQLTLEENSIINGAPFSLTKMIVSDGVATSEGLRKFFNTIAVPTNFTFPVGVTGKYTPAVFTINTNSTIGSVTVIPTNLSHPAVDDPLNVLNYYWRIESSGVSNFDSKIVLQYTPGDVKVTGANTEADYVAAELISPGTYWSKANPGPATDNVDESLHQITFNYGAGTNNISGDYTAGINAALPDEVPSYISNKDGNWSDESIWDPIGAAPPCPVGGPNGFNIIIDHVVTTNVNYCFAYQTTINGTLRVVSPSFGHNLGTVTGSGTLYLDGPNIPAGTFSDFLKCESGGTIEYGGSGNYTIIASLYDAVPNLYFTGSGTRTLPSKDLTICNRLKIDGPTLDNSVSNRKLTIQGTIERYNTGAFRSGTGANAIVSFAGTAAQTLGGPLGDFTGANYFNHLEINNVNGLNIGTNGIVDVYGFLYLTNGIITTSSTQKLTMVNVNSNSVIPVGGSSTSFINGPLIKRISSGGSFQFPIGKGTSNGHAFTVKTPLPSSFLYWIAEYFSPNSTYNSLTLPLEASNTKEYWSLKNKDNSNAATVKIGWDPASDLTPSMTVNGLVDMRVAEYSAGSWIEKTSTTTGDVNNGDVATSNNLTISTTPINYTTASVTTTKPKASLSPTGPVCGSVGIPVTFSVFTPITLNYTLDYTIDGVAQPTITITSLPYTLPTPVAGAYKLTNFTYNNGADIGVVNPTVVNVYAVPPTANAGLDQSLCSVSGVSLTGNNPAPYSGLWTKVSGIGGTILTPTAFNSGFNGTLGNTYTLRWTISNATCTSFDDVVIAFNVAPQRPSNFTSAPTPVCQGNSGVYTVPNIPAATFNWSYTGSGASIGGTPLPINGLTNSVTINFDATATSGTLSVTATNACGTSIARSVPITILTKPTIALDTNPSVCRGTTTASLSYSATTGSPDQYSIVFDATAITAGFINVTNAALPASPISITVPAGAAVATYNATLTVRNATAGCVSIAYPIVITINPLPTITLGSNPAVCLGNTSTSLTYSATTNSPDLYSIDFDATAEGQGFVDVTNVALPVSPISITVPASPIVSTYNATLTVTNSVTGCISSGYSITITIRPLPTSNVTGLTAPLTSPVCEGETAIIDIILTGQPNFNFTVQDDQGSSWNVVNLNVASGSTYSYTVPGLPITLGPGPSTTYIYTVTNLVDGNGCSEATPAGSATLQVFILPTTGPQYHIPNSFGY